MSGLLTSPPLVALARIRRAWEGIDHPEGVAVEADGTVWATGEHGQVYRGQLDGAPTLVATLPSQALGVTIDGRGDAYVTTYDETGVTQALYRVGQDGSWDAVSRGTEAEPDVAPNFSILLPSGVLLYTDSGTFGSDDGRLIAVDADGSRVVDTTARRFPNGLALAADGVTVAVAESTLPGVSLLTAAPYGELGARRVLAELPGTVPDGVAFDERGRVLVACYEPNAIFLVDPDGGVTLLAHDPDGGRLARPTNLAFVPGTTTVVVANLEGEFLSLFEHEVGGIRPAAPPALVPARDH